MSGLTFFENLLSAGVTRGTPLVFASLGELFTERAGILNLGVEGMMLLGAATGFGVAYHSGSVILGFIAAMGAAALIALFHGLVTVILVGDQVVSGLGLGFMGMGLASVVGANLVGVAGAPRAMEFEVSYLSSFPLLGPALFSQGLVVYLGFLAIPMAWLYLYRSRFGLKLRAVGENPTAADAQGINVTRVRLAHVAAGGALAGCAGASMSLAITPGWVDGMTSGQGWIAIGLVIFGGWNPWRTALGAYFFGAIRRLPLDLQGIQSLPLFRNPNLGYFLDMLPYAFTVFVLIFSSRRKGRQRQQAPAALGLPFMRGERGK